MSAPARSRGKRAWALAAAVVAALGVGELGARLGVPVAPPLRFGQVRESVDQTLHDQYGYDGEAPADGHVRQLRFDELFVGDPELFWRFGPNRVLPDDHWPFFGLLSNAAGLREDHEVPLAKPAGQVRLLFVGDSCTFGMLLPDGATLAQQVEERLRERHAGLDVECINAGVPGYTVFQGWRFLETRGFAYDPDLVVLDFGRNGAVLWDGRGDLEHYEAWRARQPIPGLRWSRLCQLFWSAVHGDASATATLGAPPRQRLRPDEYRLLLERIGEAARERGIDLLLLAGAGRANLRDGDPTWRSEFQQETYRFGESHRFGPDFGPGYVDAVPLAQELARTHAVEEIFLDHVHPTALTNGELAEAFVRKIEPWLRARTSTAPR